jgi:hypothetical protein
MRQVKRAFGTWPSWPCRLLLVLPALTALTLVQIAGAQCVTPTAGLVSWWPGEGSAEDIAGGHPGVLMSGVTFVPGKVGQAFNFDGVSSYVRLPDNCFPYPVAGVTLYLDLNNNGQYDSGEPIAVSSDDDPSTPSVDEAGRYCFDHLTLAPVWFEN